MKRYLTRYEVREIIRKCIALGCTLTEIKQTVRYHEQRQKDFVEQRYGW